MVCVRRCTQCRTRSGPPSISPPPPCYRSATANQPWLSALGPVMDAPLLVMSTVEDESEGPARLMFTVGNHLVEDLSGYFRLRSSAEPYVERQEFDEAVARLRKAGTAAG